MQVRRSESVNICRGDLFTQRKACVVSTTFSGFPGEIRRRVLGSSDRANPMLPVGVTLIGPAWSDEWLWELGADMHEASGLTGPIHQREHR